MKTSEINTECSVDAIKHSGIISKIDEKNYYVTIVAQSACSACHAKGICNVSELQEETVEVPKTSSGDHKVGEKVEVLMERTLGTRAVFLGYFLPFLILLFALIITTSIIDNEGIAGLISLSVLIPYYLLLYFKKDKLKKKFVFRIG
jgi:sigma-E factor negative regulatory protein RseC